MTATTASAEGPRPDQEAPPITAGRTAGSFYSPQLDGLRFLAALAVFFHHAPPIAGLGFLKTYGWAGVDLFLVISAYLLTRLLMLEHGTTGTISLKSFFIRRALRIWPLYLGYVTAITVAAVVTHMTSVGVASYWWLSHLSFSNNILVAVKGYSVIPFTEHLWTISLEEQAYLVLPFVLAGCLAARPSRRFLLVAGTCVILTLIIARTALVLANAQHPFIWVLPLRADSIVLGSVAALALGTVAPARANVVMLFGIACLASIALFPSVDVIGLYQVLGFTVTALGCCALTIATQGPGMVLNGVLGSRPMRLLGKVSFGFYVYHNLMLYLVRKLFERLGVASGPAVFLLALALTIAVAIISYNVYEAPFLKLKRRFTIVRSRPV